MSDYDYVSKSSLKLKRSDGMVVKSKKKRKKEKIKTMPSSDELQKYRQTLDKTRDDDLASAAAANGGHPSSSATTSGSSNWMTAAERKFLDMQTKRQTDRIMEKASKSHKQRVEEFNTNLENLSEHYDIPKVSWTK